MNGPQDPGAGGPPGQPPPGGGWGQPQQPQAPHPQQPASPQRPPAQQGWGPPGAPAPGAAPPQAGWSEPHYPQPPAVAHENPDAVRATGLGGATGQAYLAMFSRKPIKNARVVGLSMIGFAAVLGMIQLALIAIGGVYTWHVMLLMFGSGVPGTWLAVMGDEPDPQTGLVPKSRRTGLIASFVVGLVLAFAASTFLVWVVGIEHL